MDHCLKLYKNNKIMIIGGCKQAHENIKNKYQLKNTFFYNGFINEKNFHSSLLEKFTISPLK